MTTGIKVLGAWIRDAPRLKYPCWSCGHDIMHDGRPPRECTWNWNARWQSTWYQIGQQHYMRCMYG